MPKHISLVTLTLRGMQLPLKWCMTSYRPKIGTTGWSSDRTYEDNPTYRTAPLQSNSTSSLVFLHITVGATTVEAVNLALKHQKPPSVMWHRPLSRKSTQNSTNHMVQPNLASPSPVC